MKNKTVLLILAVLGLAGQGTRAQMSGPTHSLSANLIMPQARSSVWRPPAAPGAVQITGVSASVNIVEQVATTTLEIAITNSTSSRLEAQMIVPVPDRAALRGFTFQGAAGEPVAELLARDEARRIYDSIVTSMRDPALLEFIGCNLIRSSVFPVEPRGVQKVRLVYEHLLAADGDRVDYVLPRTESIDYKVPWTLSVKITSKTPVTSVYSPSHRLETTRKSEHVLTACTATDAATEPGPFRFSYLRQSDGMTASLIAYPDPKVGGGYFLLLASPPVKAPQAGSVKREVILVIDRSGSMAGEKIEQARQAALQVLEGLDDGETFNVILYSEDVSSFAAQPVVKNAASMQAVRAFLRRITARGGTNLHDALVEALRMKPADGCLPLVLFLTDGLPTVGQTSEKAIRDVVSKANPHERRVFTFGVGVDVNTPLLDKIALESRATATFVLPREDVEVKVGQVFKRLVGPVLTAPKLQVRDGDGRPALGRVTDLLPGRLPDLFEGDQLVLLGQYTGEDPLHFTLTGDYFGAARTFKFRFNLDKATVRNAYVPRLWASRKIAALTDAIRDMGADSGLNTLKPSPSDPRMKELVTEIVRLSKEFGILTEYTAFLAREGTDLGRTADNVAQAADTLNGRAMQMRSGFGSVNQEFNQGIQRSQMILNTRNQYIDKDMNRVEINSVQQMNDRAFYRRGNRWVDNALVDTTNATPQKVVEIGTEEFRRLTDRLAEQNRQSAFALGGEIVLQVDGTTYLVK
jgi:Ca-activated chloride channel family protein